MKQILLGTLLVGLLFGCISSKNVPVKNVPLKYQGVIDAPGLTKSQIIHLVNLWAVDSYHNYKDVFQYRDSTYLALNGITSYTTTYSMPLAKGAVKDYAIHYHLRVEAKDNKCRLTLDGFRTVGESNAMLTKTEQMNLLDNTKTTSAIRESLRTDYLERYNHLDQHSASLFKKVAAASNERKEDW